MSYATQKYIALNKQTGVPIYLGIYEGTDAQTKAATDAGTAPEHVCLIPLRDLDKEPVQNRQSDHGTKVSLSIKDTDDNTTTLSTQDLAVRLGLTDISEITLAVENENNISISATVDALEQDYPSIIIDGTDNNGCTMWLAQTELPNENYPDTVTTRLYAGYESFEPDMPMAMVATHILSLEEQEKRRLTNEQRQNVSAYPSKIIHVDHDIAQTRSWTCMKKDETIQEHEPEY